MSELTFFSETPSAIPTAPSAPSKQQTDNTSSQTPVSQPPIAQAPMSQPSVAQPAESNASDFMSDLFDFSESEPAPVRNSPAPSDQSPKSVSFSNTQEVKSFDSVSPPAELPSNSFLEMSPSSITVSDIPAAQPPSATPSISSPKEQLKPALKQNNQRASVRPLPSSQSMKKPMQIQSKKPVASVAKGVSPAQGESQMYCISKSRLLGVVFCVMLLLWMFYYFGTKSAQCTGIISYTQNTTNAPSQNQAKPSNSVSSGGSTIYTSTTVNGITTESTSSYGV